MVQKGGLCRVGIWSVSWFSRWMWIDEVAYGAPPVFFELLSIYYMRWPSLNVLSHTWRPYCPLNNITFKGYSAKIAKFHHKITVLHKPQAWKRYKSHWVWWSIPLCDLDKLLVTGDSFRGHEIWHARYMVMRYLGIFWPQSQGDEREAGVGALLLAVELMVHTLVWLG